MAAIELKDCTKVTLEDIEVIAADARGLISRVYAHWTAGHYGQGYDDYHILIDRDGSVYVTTEDLAEEKSHTWQRNFGAIGIAMLCGYGAIANKGRDADLGPEPPTDIQITALSQVAAVLSDVLGIDLDREHFMTHCEAAQIDGYGPFSGDPETRWDLWYLPDINNGGKMVPGGDLWRGIANFYLAQWLREGSNA